MKNLGYFSFVFSLIAFLDFLAGLLFYRQIAIVFYFFPWIGIFLGGLSLGFGAKEKDKIFAILGIIIGSLIPIYMFLVLMIEFS
ncbi:MAG: hypothetical protein AABW51_03665 [Nanoarchaeota archaeon]